MKPKNCKEVKKEDCSYLWEVLYKDDESETKLVTWPVGARSCAHDHGESRGVVRVIEGEINQKIFNKETKEFIEEQNLKAGDVFFETPDMIHVMGNSSTSVEAKTLHMYTPPLKMKRYPECEGDDK